MKHIAAALTLTLTLAFAASPFFTDPFTGFRADQRPIPQINPPIQPAGYAFAIWGLIYTWLIVSAVFGLWKRPQNAQWNKARAPLILSLAVGVPWLAIANASAIWATLSIFWMAGFAIAALIRAPIKDRWWLQAPIALYAGWLTAASCVSLVTTMAGYGILFDGYSWAFIGILAALAISLGTFRACPSAPEYLAAVIWALIGVMVANNMERLAITSLAGLGIVVLLGAIVTNIRPRKS